MNESGLILWRRGLTNWGGWRWRRERDMEEEESEWRCEVEEEGNGTTGAFL